jgi:hypothetical protein
VRTIVATTPAGTQWRVRVVWQPRWQALTRRFAAWRRKGGGGGDWDGAAALDAADNLLVGLAMMVGIILFGLLFWFLLLPLLLLVVDLLVVLVLLALAIPARVLLRRPWTIEAVAAAPNGRERRLVTQTVGWRKALAMRDEIIRKIREGHPDPV